MSEQIVLIYGTATNQLLAAFTRSANADEEIDAAELAPEGISFRSYDDIDNTFQIGVEHLGAGVASVPSVGGILGNPHDYFVEISDDKKTITPGDLPNTQIPVANVDTANIGSSLIAINNIAKIAGDGDEITFWALVEGVDFSETAQATAVFDANTSLASAELRFGKRPQSGHRLLIFATNRQPFFMDIP